MISTVCAVASSGLLAALTRLALRRNSGDMIGGPETGEGIVQDGEDMPAFYGNYQDNSTWILLKGLHVEYSIGDENTPTSRPL